MAHFYGVVKGGRSEATRTGTKNSGMQTIAASYAGAVQTVLWYDESDGKNHYEIRQIPWQGVGQGKLVAVGIVGE